MNEGCCCTGKETTVRYQRIRNSPPAAVIDGAKDTEGATGAAIPENFHLYLVCAPGSASQFGDLRLTEQLQQLTVGTKAISGQMILEKYSSFRVVHTFVCLTGSG